MHKLSTRRRARAALAAVLFLFALAGVASAQGEHTLWGDVKVNESKVAGHKSLAFDIVLYTETGNVVGRQTVPNMGRYRFMNLVNGNYDLVVEVEGAEVARVRVRVVASGAMKSDYQQDIEMEWCEPAADSKPGNVSAADFYKRTGANQKLFGRAEEALNASKYEDAVALLQQVVASDAKDYQAWSELGTAYISQQKADEAEKAYLAAADAKPTYAPALINLGRLRVMRKNFDGAVEVLTKAVALTPPSAEANLLLGESYLQLKKGSKAVPYLEEAARLGRADAHLRLATLYNAVGLKDRAAAEYEQYLAKKPDAPDRKKLEEYIKENKKQ